MRHSSGPYQACGPSCSCSSPPGIVSHSRSGTPWCCKCWRSLSPLAWPCSPPTAEAGMSAERDGSNSAEPLRAFCLWNILACAPLMQPFDLVLSVYMVINVLLCLWEAIAHLLNVALKMNLALAPWWIHVHGGVYCGSFSPTLLLFLFSLCPFIVLPTRHAGTE